MNIRALLLAVAFLIPIGCSSDSGSGGAPVSQAPTGPEPEAASGWTAQMPGGSFYFGNLAAVDADHAWNTGPITGLRATTDGGGSWSMAPDYGFRGIQFLDAQHGWAMSQGAVFSTSDGGASWEARLSSMGMPNGLSFLSPTTGWVSTSEGTLFATTDGGSTWSSAFLGRWLGAVKFVSSQVGWMVSNVTSPVAGGAILKTTDGGATWEEQLVVEGESTFFARISAVDEIRAWAVGRLGEEGELIVATTNGGSTWTQQQSDNSGPLRSVYFVDANHGWAVGLKVHATADGGATWKVQSTPMDGDPLGFFDVIFVDAATGWVCGGHGEILKTTTGGE